LITPARAAGLLPGDEIKTADGRAAAEIGWEGLRRIFLRDGKDVKMEISRSGKNLFVILKLRRLV
jgi:C-terminal processing protease CtpA/Prc